MPRYFFDTSALVKARIGRDVLAHFTLFSNGPCDELTHSR